ncbi:MAG TPA: hypothetical protein VK903_09955, partial [Propionicimonas sp.]|nr:hypothetical protein [Propionicimonas sp.]
MRQVLGDIRAALRDVLHITFVTPVREGRPHPSAWPRGLREVGLATVIVFGLLAAAILLAGPLRQYGTLAMSTTTADGVPELVLPLLLTGVLLSFALIVTAALHAVWWLRLLLLVLGAAAVLFFSAQAWTNPVQLAVSVVAYLAVVVFAFVRAFRGHAWWEFPVVSVLLMVATLFPWTSPLVGAGYGVDFRPGALHGALISLQFLVLPAVMVAGSAPAQIVVTGAQAAAGRPVSARLFWTGFAVAVGWLVVATVLGAGGRELRWPSLAASALILIVAGAMTAVLLRRAGVRVPPAPGAYPEVWGGWLYPLATAVTVVVALTLPVIIVRGVLQLL